MTVFTLKNYEKGGVFMKKMTKKWLIVGVGSLVICGIIGVMVVKIIHPKAEPMPTDVVQFLDGNQPQEDNEVNQRIFVDVKGQVHLPGVYEMEQGKRIIDAIDQAGGFLEDADQTKVNLAALLNDEMVVFVPMKYENGEQSNNEQFGNVDFEGKVRINYATHTEIEKLPGIGPVKAAAIIKYRENNGFFTSDEELLQVKGIGPQSLEKLKEVISIH
jgi:competence protein ComEA